MTRAAVAFLLFACALPARAAVFIVRHAEKVDPKADASLLSAKGKERAKALRHALSSVDLKAVYCTEYKRTQQTAGPSAEARKLTPIVLDSGDVKGLAAALKARPASEDTLVVGHTDTIPDLLKLLGVESAVTLESGDYDNLFIVRLKDDGAPEFHRLHYGAPSPPSKK